MTQAELTAGIASAFQHAEREFVPDDEVCNLQEILASRNLKLYIQIHFFTTNKTIHDLI